MSSISSEWKHNSFAPGVFRMTSPLLDNSNTPRGAKRLITLERNLDKDPWIHNKSDLGNFEEAKKDKKKAKLLKILKKKKLRLESSKNVSLNNS